MIAALLPLTTRSMKKLLGIILSFFLLSTVKVQAQAYNTSFGLRMGKSPAYNTVGLSVQQRVFSRMTLEGILQTDFKHNSTAHILLEKHNPIICKRFNY